MEIRNEEGDVVPCYWFSPQDDKVLRSLHHEPSELVAEHALNFVGLFDADRESDRVDGWLDGAKGRAGEQV